VRFAGEFAALGTALCWGAGSNFFAAAGLSMGAIVLNRLRISIALLFLAGALLVTRGSPWPTWATGAQILVLGASGLIGFVFGDNFYFRSLLVLGPGRAAMLACLAPPFTALFAVPLLGERLGPLAFLGMALTLAGVAWAILDRDRVEHQHFRGPILVGVATGVLGALGQAGGYVLSKIALKGGLDALSATVIRVAIAVAFVWIVAAASGDVSRSILALRNRSAAAAMIGGAFCGPFLGVTLSLFALAHAEAGVAASIAAFYPIPTLIISRHVHAEPITPRVVTGGLIAIAGVVILFVR
jgi:drug/metabolite transporter (DMT)-like permease